MRRSSLLLSALLGGAIVGPAHAQEPVRLELSLVEATRTAVAHSPEFVILREELVRSRALIDYEEGAFHPSLIVDVRGTYLDDPGGTSTFAEKRKALVSLLGLQGTLITGMRYQVGVELLLEDVDSVFTDFERGQTLRFRIEATQPLLRGGWLAANRSLIVIRTAEEKRTRALLHARAAELLAQVETAYWRLVLAREELRVQRDALQLSVRQVEDSKAQLKLGAVAPIQVLEAEVAVSRRQATIEASNAAIAVAESELAIMILSPEQRKTELTVIPTDHPEVDPLSTSAVEDLELAYREREDLSAARADVEAADEALAAARRALLPALDLLLSGNLTGFSGRLVEPKAEIDDPELVGDFGDVFGNTRHPSALVGLRLELPLTNDRAQAAEEVASAEYRQRQAREEELKNRVYSEVLEARRTLLADLRRVDAAKILVARTEALLTGQRQSFKAGAAVSFDVVRATVDVTRARIQLLRAQVSAEISHSRLLLAKGQYLNARRVALEPDGNG